MNAANEAAAPDAEPAIESNVPIEPIVANAPNAPNAPNVPTAAELADEALAFQPTRFRVVVTQPFWAGLLGAGVGLWAGSSVQAYSHAYIISRQNFPVAVFAPMLLAFSAALWRGYRAPVQGYKALFGRIVGALFYGGMSAGLTVAILGSIFNGLGLRDHVAFTVLALMSALLAGLALMRLYGIGTDKPRRIKIGTVVGAVVLVSVWPVVPSLRCRLGFGEGCREAYAGVNDSRSGGQIAQRGCELENAFSCRVAGEHFKAEGPGRDLRRAAGFFSEGCALGDAESCDGVHELELLQRCDRYGAFACVELARAHESGDGMTRDRALAQRYYRKACLLGADDACAQASGR